MAQKEASAEQLLADFEHWRTKYSVDPPGLIHSPECEEFERAKWFEYEGLEARRRRLSLAPLDWQAEEEADRQATSEGRLQLYKPLEGDLLGKGPLRIQLERFLSPDPHSGHRYEGPAPSVLLRPWKATLDSWAAFQDLYASNSAFRSYLNPFLQNSYLILKDWWAAAYCDSALPRAAQAYIECRRDSVSRDDPTSESELEAASGNDAAKTSLSLYHAMCFNLFIQEFHPRGFEPFISLSSLLLLGRQRFAAARHASTQRFSFAALIPKPLVATPDKGPASYPTVTLNESRWAPEPNFRQHPKYLWDSEQAKTVIFASFAKPPEYICISHTWGRWREEESAEIDGVPWPVPRNSRFNVDHLPAKLKGLGCRFVWFDLFCIPQNESLEASEEISLQSYIFRGSRACVAWLNDIESWDGVKSGLRWLALKWLKGTVRPCDDFPVGKWSNDGRADGDLATAARAADLPAELCQETGPQPNAWFSSLWTLQEAVLCPDLQLCSRNWETLVDEWGTPVSLTVLMVFLNMAMHFCVADGPIETSFVSRHYSRALNRRSQGVDGFGDMINSPQSARQLLYIGTATRLEVILAFRSLTAFFASASVRHCGDKNRAPAIMSALGVTGWYRSAPPRPRGEQPKLVLGMYPLAFLQELHQKFGASLFETHAHWVRLDPESKQRLRERTGMGTMLPFTARGGWFADSVIGSVGADEINIVDHPSVSTWQIREDGSVKATKAGVFLFQTTPQQPGPKVQGSALYVTEEGARSSSTDDMAKLLSEIAGKDGVVYAVSLYTNGRQQTGILLYHLRHGNLDSSTKYLVKVGIFSLSRCTDLKSLDVDWVIL